MQCRFPFETARFSTRMNGVTVLDEWQGEEYNYQHPVDETKKWVNNNRASSVGLAHRNMTDPYFER
jgi:hypothetical protein